MVLAAWNQRSPWWSKSSPDSKSEIATATQRAPLSVSSSPNRSRNSVGERSDGTGGRRGTRIDMAGETVAMRMPKPMDQAVKPRELRRSRVRRTSSRANGINIPLQGAFVRMVHSSILRSRMSSGRAPWLSSSSWKARMSKRAPAGAPRARASRARQLAALVRQRLRRHHDIAIDLARDVLLRLRAVGLEVSIACSLVHPSSWMPVSSTSRIARHISYVNWPNLE